VVDQKKMSASTKPSKIRLNKGEYLKEQKHPSLKLPKYGRIKIDQLLGIVQHSSTGFVLIDLDAKILDCNLSLYKMLGYTRKGLPGKGTTFKIWLPHNPNLNYASKSKIL